ncbi:hypothetical protein [Achromobacter insuavis]|uniref:hypothetical protein n=1 Tax=Achromobacter insuavis TaxID=1287735 RepID=UPI001F13B430|nr:hypothetical protein [Achromobacter insuavis]
MTISSVTPSSPFVSLEAFAKAAESGQDVYVDVAGEKLQVLGMGTTPGGRSVAWVAPNVDTTAMFAQALARSYGQGIASAVSRELGLEPNPGKPLSARTVAQALDMAQTSRDALSGVDFLTRLALSATNGAPAFQQAVAMPAWRPPASMPPAAARWIRPCRPASTRPPSPARARSPWAPPPPGCATCSRPAEPGAQPPPTDSGPRNHASHGLLVFTFLTLKT